MKFASWILLLMTTVMTTFNPMNSIMKTTENQAVEDAQEESRSEKEDYASLIGALEDFANTSVDDQALLDWNYETMKAQIQNDLGNGTWSNASNASANYTSENVQYNAAAEDGSVTGFTSEETTTYQESAYIRNTANISTNEASLTVAEQKAIAGEAESYSVYHVTFAEDNQFSFSNMVYEIEDKEMQDKLLINEDQEWTYEVEFEDGSSLNFYLVQNISENKTEDGSDPVIRTVSYENGEKTITAGFGCESLKEITVNIEK